MTSPARRLSFVSSLLALSLACSSPGPATKPKDASVSGRASARATARSAAAPRAQDRLANYDARSAEAMKSAALRASSFRWVTRGAASAAARAAVPADAVSAARAHLGLAAPAAKTATGLDEAVVAGVHDTGRGPVIVQFQRKVNGLEVFGERSALAMDRQLRPVARSGVAPAAARAAPALRPFALDASAAMAAALSDVAGEAYTTGDLVAAPDKDGYARAGLAPATASARGVRLVTPARARKVLFPLASGLVPAYRVEVAARDAAGLHGFAYVVSAVDGSVLFRRNQVQNDAYQYRVWVDPDTLLPQYGPQGLAGLPHPTGLPDLILDTPVDQSLVTLQNFPFSQNDPWLPPSSDQTIGNNVIAYTDWDSSDDYTDPNNFVGQTSDTGTFDWGAYAFDVQPYDLNETIMGGISQLFYITNFLHDWYYDSGFDEVAGNAQESNYGRGGVEGDPLHAEAQDFGGVDNANMMTPADGNSPRMQMYLWNGNARRQVQVTVPAGIAGTYEGQVAEFGPTSFDITGTVVAAVPATACTAITNGGALSGNVALIDRGGCTFVTKVLAAQAAGAAAVIIRNVTSAQAFGTMGGTDSTVTTAALLVSLDTGALIGGQLDAGVTARVYREAVPYRDGSLDTLIVSHEWGHYISNRLIGNGDGLVSNQSGGLGEGWGDTSAMAVAVRAEDAAAVANADWAGTFGLAGWVTTGVGALGTGTTGYYFGVRRVPYSTDMTKDPLTFGMIADGQPLVPDGSTIPIAFGTDGSDNSEVHNTGEVWATMLWECYASLLRDTLGDAPRLTFAEAQGRWKDYLVAAFKLTPLNPTLLEARDAMLAVAYASDPRDYALFWQAFAKRGAGAGALGPDRWSLDNNPVVESYLAGPHLSFVSATFAPTAGTCSDGDAYLDIGEKGTYTVLLRNDGQGALVAGTATPGSDTTNLTFPGGDVAVPASNPGETVSVSVPAALSGTSGAVNSTLVLTFPAASALAGETVNVPLVLNRDVVPASSRADDFRTSVETWTVDGTFDGQPGWKRTDGTYWGEDPDGTSDLRLVSPDLIVGTGDFSLSVSHRYQFEAYPSYGLYFDGGVIELSDDGGATWTDIGESVYDGTLESGGTNPLAGRDAFTWVNYSYPSYDTVGIDLGTDYAGKTVKIRFRIGSDEATGFGGWNIARVEVTGTTNTPFPALTLDAGKCSTKTSGSSGSGCSSGAGALSAAALLFLVAAFLFRLPRRRDGR